LRQYYLSAKYFRELGYSRLYEADVAAYREDTNAAALPGDKPMRNLRTLRDSTVAEQQARIEETRARFSPERWDAYKRDVRHFRTVMGDNDYFETMLDFGPNATPVWMSIGALLFGAFQPSERVFTATGAMDLVLLLVTFVAIGRTFGIRTMFVCM